MKRSGLSLALKTAIIEIVCALQVMVSKNLSTFRYIFLWSHPNFSCQYHISQGVQLVLTLIVAVVPVIVGTGTDFVAVIPVLFGTGTKMYGVACPRPSLT